MNFDPSRIYFDGDRRDFSNPDRLGSVDYAEHVVMWQRFMAVYTVAKSFDDMSRVLSGFALNLLQALEPLLQSIKDSADEFSDSPEYKLLEQRLRELEASTQALRERHGLNRPGDPQPPAGGE